MTLTDRIPSWWIWGFWVSPLMYAQEAATVNEFLGHSWNKVHLDWLAFEVGPLPLNSDS